MRNITKMSLRPHFYRSFQENLTIEFSLSKTESKSESESKTEFLH